MSDWLNLELPYANQVGYTFSKNMRFMRSTMASALPQQIQLSNSGKKIFSVSWTLTQEEVNKATLYLLEKGFTWFEIELISEEGLILHEVRLIDTFKTEPISGQLYKITAQFETKIDPTTCYPTVCDSFEPIGIITCDETNDACIENIVVSFFVNRIFTTE